MIPRLPTPPPGYREIPEYLNLAGELVDRIKERGFSDRLAFVSDNRQVTFRDAALRINRLTSAFAARGILRGMPVLILMRNCHEFAETFLALVKLGALPVLQNSLSRPDEVRHVIDHSEASAVVTLAEMFEPLRNVFDGLRNGVVVARGVAPGTDSYEELLEDAKDTVHETADTRSSDPAFLVYSSGTTGKPKGILHAHRWIIALGDSNRFRVPPITGDRILATGEWSFISALGHNVLFPLRNGNTGIILEQRPTPINILSAIEKHRVTLLYSVATVYRRILAMEGVEKNYDLSSLRGCNATGEALETATWEQFRSRIGCEIWEHYGVSEMQMVMGQGPLARVRPGAAGYPMPGTAVAITNDDYRSMPDGEPGHLLIEADNPGFFLGYHRDPERTQQVLRDGWYHTGDLAYRDTDGYVWLAGRSDDCFKSRGIFISPYEIENVIRQHPAIAEACVVPLADPDIGNRIRAVCVLRENQEAGTDMEQRLRAHLEPRLAPYKVPHLFEFVDGLPTSAVGKVLRRELIT